MGKKRHTQDKLWITYKELSLDWSGKKDTIINQERYLPFDFCSLSLSPFVDPVCDNEGNVYDNKYIIPYIAKYKKNPLNGTVPFSISNLTKLHFYKGKDNNYACPITLKEFNDNMKIVVIKETGNVFSYEAFNELNKKANNKKDLLNDVEFSWKNVIIINDPEKRKLIMNFAFLHEENEVNFINNLVNNIEKDETAQNANVNLPSNYIKMLDDFNNDTSEEKIRKMQVIEMINNNDSINSNEDYYKEIKGEYENLLQKISQIDNDLLDNKIPINKIKESLSISSNCFIYYLKQTEKWKTFYKSHNNLLTNGKMALSLTSTEMNVDTKSINVIPTDNELRTLYQNIVKSKQLKGYMSISTTLGDINIEILCDKAPLAAENFLELCQKGKYDNTPFHRLVKNFVIQGGDIKSTSIYGKPFVDEFSVGSSVSHNQKGILSMANSGKNTNTTQFFITLDENKAGHLDGKHTIFGKVVGGLKVLDLMNSIGNDKDEKSLQEIKILKCKVMNNPFRDSIRELMWKEIMKTYDVQEKKQYEKDIQILEQIKKITREGKETGVGKYLGKKRDNKEDIQQKIQMFKDNESLYAFESSNKKQKYNNEWQF